MDNFLDYLQKITCKDPQELKRHQVAFLRARRSYLSQEEEEKFATILDKKSGRPKKTT